MEQKMNGKHFSITDPKGVKTVIYEVSKTDKETARLDFNEQIVGEKTKKTFFINEPKPEGNKLVILSFGHDKVVINNGVLEGNEVLITKKPMPFKFRTLYNEEDTEYKEVEYTPNLKRPISIIDPETAEEVKPVLYFDDNTNEVKGKCKLKAYKNYFAFEVRELTEDRINIVGGNPVFEE